MKLDTWQEYDGIAKRIFGSEFKSDKLSDEDVKKHIPFHESRSEFMVWASKYIDGWACALWTPSELARSNHRRPVLGVSRDSTLIAFAPTSSYPEIFYSFPPIWKRIQVLDLPKDFPRQLLSNMWK